MGPGGRYGRLARAHLSYESVAAQILAPAVLGGPFSLMTSPWLGYAPSRGLLLLSYLLLASELVREELGSRQQAPYVWGTPLEQPLGPHGWIIVSSQGCSFSSLHGC